MMQSALRSILLADTATTAATSTRIDWGWRPQGKPVPAITLNTVSDPRPKHMAGNQATRATVVQLDSWAATYIEARTAANAAIAALVPQIKDGVRFLGFFVENDTDLSEDTSDGLLARISVDLRVLHTIP
jgi:hypothetical protein